VNPIFVDKQKSERARQTRHIRVNLKSFFREKLIKAVSKMQSLHMTFIT